MKHSIQPPNRSFKIDGITVGQNAPSYFIADIGANHDGDLIRAKELIHMCAEAGANAAKFQHFDAATIVSDYGFKRMDRAAMSHQATWKKSVFEVYHDASIQVDWTAELKETCDQARITFMTTPYSRELVDLVDPFVSAYKIGSGDITWTQHIEYIASKGKPVILANGASNLDETVRAVEAVLHHTGDVALLQCNTNYTASDENFDYIHLNVLKTYERMYPQAILGLSDHTPGHATVLGAVALGGRVIEKHFTDDNNRIGPDHKFAMNPKTWQDMVHRTRELERALGDGIKRVEPNEKDTVVVQRRCLRASADLPVGYVLSAADMEALRPCPADAIAPFEADKLVGRKLIKPMPRGEHFTWMNLQ
jgi:sialic acid synthase SpsE